MKSIMMSSRDIFESGILVFEDIVRLDDRAIQKIVYGLDKNQLAEALKGASSEVQDKFLRNMSKNAAKMLKEDMSVIGSISINDVEKSQENIVSHIRRLEDSGEIFIPWNSEGRIDLR